MILTFYQLCITIRERVKEVAKFLPSNRINKIERQNSQSHCSICQSDLYVMTLCFSLSRDCLHSPDTLKIKCKL